MKKTKTVVCQLNLGKTRVAGYTLFDHSNLEFCETTAAAVGRLISDGKVNGLVFDGQANEAGRAHWVSGKGNIIPDVDGFNMKSLLIKSGVGNYSDFYDETKENGTIYSVVRAYDVENSGRMYEVINNLCLRVFMTAKKILGLNMVAQVAGVRIEDDDIELCDGVEVITINAGSWEELCSCFIPNTNDGVTDAPANNVIQMPPAANDGSDGFAQAPEGEGDSKGEREKEPEKEPEQVENSEGTEVQSDGGAESASMEELFGGVTNSPEEMTDTGAQAGDAPKPESDGETGQQTTDDSEPEGETGQQAGAESEPNPDGETGQQVGADGADQSGGANNTAKKDDNKKGSKNTGKKKR